MSEGRYSGKRWNRIQDEALASYKKLRDGLVDDLLADGYPPGAEPKQPIEIYHTLIAMRDAQDPAFWGSAQAQRKLAQLEMQFGSAGVAPAQQAPVWPGRGF